MTLRDANDRYLQDDGTVDATCNTIRHHPGRPGCDRARPGRGSSPCPTEGTWQAQIRATRHRAARRSLDTIDRTWNVTENGQTPAVSISAPGSVVPPTAPQLVTVAAGRAR